jgi:hypothetical protein
MPPAFGEIEELVLRDDRPAKEGGRGVCAAVLVGVGVAARLDGVVRGENEGLGAVEDPGEDIHNFTDGCRRSGTRPSGTCEVVDVVVVAPDLLGLLVTSGTTSGQTYMAYCYVTSEYGCNTRQV